MPPLKPYASIWGSSRSLVCRIFGRMGPHLEQRISFWKARWTKCQSIFCLTDNTRGNMQCATEDFILPTHQTFFWPIFLGGCRNLINCWDIITALCSVITIMDRYKANFVWVNLEKRLGLQKSPPPPCPHHHLNPLGRGSFLNSPIYIWCSRYFA